jgi:hypothetical protein
VYSPPVYSGGKTNVPALSVMVIDAVGSVQVNAGTVMVLVSGGSASVSTRACTATVPVKVTKVGPRRKEVLTPEARELVTLHTAEVLPASMEHPMVAELVQH